MHEEEQHIDIREKLLNLPKVKASDDFMNALQRKINLADAELNQKKITEEVKESVWVKLFGKKRNPWLIPSLSLTIVAIIILTVYLFPTKKEISVTGLKDSDRTTSTLESAPMQEKQSELKKEELPGKEIAGDLETEKRKSDERSSYEVSKGYTEQPVMKQVVPSLDKEVERPPAPMKLDEIKDETGKTEYKKEEKKTGDTERKVSEETMAPVETKVKPNEVEQRIKNEDKKEDRSKDNIEGKGLIDNKEKMIMKKTAKSSTDSSKIDKKALEKLKEELEKKLEEKK